MSVVADRPNAPSFSVTVRLAAATPPPVRTVPCTAPAAGNVMSASDVAPAASVTPAAAVVALPCGCGTLAVSVTAMGGRPVKAKLPSAAIGADRPNGLPFHVPAAATVPAPTTVPSALRTDPRMPAVVVNTTFSVATTCPVPNVPATTGDGTPVPGYVAASVNGSTGTGSGFEPPSRLASNRKNPLASALAA